MAEPVVTDKLVKELIRVGQEVGLAQRPDGALQPYVVVPSDCKVVDLGPWLYNEHASNPERKKAVVKAHDADSFIEYFKLFRDEQSRVFADEPNHKFVAVLDYHQSAEGKPRWGEHRVELTLRQSEEWATWKGADGKKFTQMDLGEFIEDNQPDITSPSGATMLEVARDLSAKSGADFSSAITMANGSVKFAYTETVRGTYGNGSLEVPDRFTISIPIYVGSDPVSLTARFRYRVNGGKLQLWFDLLRASAAEREGFFLLHAQIAEGTAVKLINGTPA